MINIKNLHVNKSDYSILKGVNLCLNNGIHIIMGPNGCGKTTLSYSIAGHPDCNITEGSILFNDKDITHMEAFERSIEGIYLAPQYPPSIEGLSPAMLLKESLNIRRKHIGLEPLDEFEFLKTLREKANQFSFNPKTYIRQSLNVGFSGGEKKRNEMLQISILEPQVIILDEIDSGLDIDAIAQISQYIKSISKNKTIIAITHYPSFARILEPQSVNIMKNGNIILNTDSSILSEIENNGFTKFLKD
jgi:Fe-S cluster assembly ATP-binding protein